MAGSKTGPLWSRFYFCSPCKPFEGLISKEGISNQALDVFYA